MKQRIFSIKIALPLMAVIAISLSLIPGLVTNVPPAWAEEPQPEEAPKLPPPPPPDQEHRYGYVPPQMDLSHLTGQRTPDALIRGIVSSGSPPASFDWRTQGKVTPVKDQGGCGSCYAFAAIANIESRLLIEGAGTYDFSENNAKECNWQERSCSGGNYLMLASFFSQKGLVLESCDPYKPYDDVCKLDCSYEKTLLDWRIICRGVVPDTESLKSYIQEYGPVYSTLYSLFPGFSSYDGSYTLYYPGTETPDHAVLIVGWNDNLTHDGGTGGWIAKNSWGTGWGGTCGYGSEKGYFTIAYGSASIGMDSSFIYDWQDYDEGGGIMYYDEAGPSGAIGYDNTTAWGLCKFFPPSNTYVTRVEFWTTDITEDIDIYIYDSFNGTALSTLLASTENISFTEAGYHSVELDLPSPLAVTEDNDVVVVVKFTNHSYVYPLAVDDLGPHETQRTFRSPNGSSGSWVDLGAVNNKDVAIRLRTSEGVGLPSKLAFGIAPPTAVTAGVIWPPFTVEIRDQFDRLVDCTANVSVTTSAGDFSSGTTTKAAVAGVATFDDLTYNTSGTITVTATSSYEGLP